jgi:hypothetical protein
LVVSINYSIFLFQFSKLITHTSSNSYHAAFCEEILKKVVAFGSIHRAEGRGIEEEGREGNRLWVHTAHVDQRLQEVAVREERHKSQVCSFLFPFDLNSGSYLYGIGP